MKYSLPIFAFVIASPLLIVAGSTAFAQPAPSSSSSTQPLTMQDKMRLAKARNQVLENNPDLKAEAVDLKKQGQALKDGNASAEDKMNFMQSMEAHQKKMKAAMLKVDPTLAPIIDQAETEMKEKMKERAAGN